MSTPIEIANSEIAFNNAEAGNIFTELRSFYYVARKVAKDDEESERIGPFNVGLDPESLDSMSNDYESEDVNVIVADIQKSDVTTPEITGYLIDVNSGERFGIMAIAESDAMTTTVKLIKHNKKVIGASLKK